MLIRFSDKRQGALPSIPGWFFKLRRNIVLKRALRKAARTLFSECAWRTPRAVGIGIGIGIGVAIAIEKGARETSQ